ncbi:3-dehydroquinate synthase [Candidatus Micrarchaeota archaeon]|nr:3-dehydroquinate synthase [Candidatus Micrarchaeota archaeon]
MKKIELKGQNGKCEILVGEKLENIEQHINSKKKLVIVDRKIANQIREKLDSNKFEFVEIDASESAKTLQSAEQIYEKCLEMELDRESTIIGIGGGIVCDISGFIGATYLRGVRCALVPTTLLAQVDASIGGKNGVNYKGYKNLIGTIRQPETVICDFELLRTLPKSEIQNGYAEVIKHAAIADKEAFEYLQAHKKEALELEKAVIEKIVYDSLIVKSKIVERDEHESHERMKLNFGHTIGHAIEKVEKIAHGSAIAIGMVVAARISVKKKMLTGEDAERLEKLIVSYGLPTKIKSKKTHLIDAIRKDKKRRNDAIKMCLLEKIGNARIEEVTISELEEVLDDLC